MVFWSAPLVFVPILILFRMGIPAPPSVETSSTTDKVVPNTSKVIRTELFFKMNKQVFSKNLCFLALGFFCLSYITYSNLIWLPSFLFESYDMSIVQAGLFAALYPLSGIISRPLGGFISDVVFKGKRKQTIMIGLFFILLSTALLSRIENFNINIYLIITIGFFDNLIGPLFFAWMLDMVPYNRTGTGAGMLQFLGHIGTVLSIYFSGIAVDVFQSYRPFFMILSVISVLGIISIVLISESGEKK
jgi:OPA family glycerol-3-phosphate transporter-like MFS transporter